MAKIGDQSEHYKGGKLEVVHLYSKLPWVTDKGLCLFASMKCSQNRTLGFRLSRYSVVRKWKLKEAN